MRAVLERGVQNGEVRAAADLDLAMELRTSPIIAAVMTHRDRITRNQIEFTVETVLAGLRP